MQIPVLTHVIRVGVEVEVGQVFYRAAQGLLPVGVHHRELWIIFLKATVTVEIQPVVLVEQNIEGRPYRHIRAHRGVEREQGVGARNFQAGGVKLDAAVKDRPAVFDFANLQIRRSLRHTEGVSLGINEEKIGLLPLDLPALAEGGY